MNKQNHFFLEKPIDVYINSEQIIGKEFLPIVKKLSCKLIGFCTYIGEHITAVIQLGNGVVYDYIPFDSLSWKVDSVQEQKSVLYNCPGLNITVQGVAETMKKVVFTNKEKKEFYEGESLFLLDFYEDNELFIFIKTDGGGFVMRPLHKCLFNVTKELAKNVSLNHYIKQRETFKE